MTAFLNAAHNANHRKFNFIDVRRGVIAIDIPEGYFTARNKLRADYFADHSRSDVSLYDLSGNLVTEKVADFYQIVERYLTAESPGEAEEYANLIKEWEGFTVMTIRKMRAPNIESSRTRVKNLPVEYLEAQMLNDGERAVVGKWLRSRGYVLMDMYVLETDLDALHHLAKVNRHNFLEIYEVVSK